MSLRTTSTPTLPASLSLAVQYAVPAPELPRWRLRRWVRRALDGVLTETIANENAPPLGAALTLRLVDLAEGRRLNHEFRGRDYATNVLTFEYGRDPSDCVHGDIVLCVPVLHREAREQGKTLHAHAAHLTIHGVLHALGYDHLDAAEAADMEALETRILASMDIADPYAAAAPPL